MPRYVALFRGINVGKAKRIAMADLRALLEKLGFTEVRTLLKQRKTLDGVALRKMQPVVIPARDGLRLNGYLTLPAAEAGAGKDVR